LNTRLINQNYFKIFYWCWKVNIYVYGEWGESESIEKPGQIWNGFVSEEVDRNCGECTLEWSSEDKFCSECGAQEGTCECW